MTLEKESTMEGQFASSKPGNLSFQVRDDVMYDFTGPLPMRPPAPNPFENPEHKKHCDLMMTLAHQLEHEANLLPLDRNIRYNFTVIPVFTIQDAKTYGKIRNTTSALTWIIPCSTYGRIENWTAWTGGECVH